jgi:hypothetical protein
MAGLSARLRLAVLLAGCAALGCAGGAPLLHPAHVLRPGVVTVGAGLSGEAALPSRIRVEAGGAPGEPAEPLTAGEQAEINELTVAAGIAPWVGARVGIAGSNEAGLTYTGRAIRVDGRHAFSLGVPSLSVGLGAAALIAQRPGEGRDASSVYGAAFDVPVLLGFRSRGDLYALWFGPRAGFELLRGKLARSVEVEPGVFDLEFVDVSAQHLEIGFVLGVRGGFRHVHVAIEAGAAYHRANADLGGSALALEQATLTPGGALLITF